MKTRQEIEKEVKMLKSQLRMYDKKRLENKITEKVYLFYKHVYEDSILALEWVLGED